MGKVKVAILASGSGSNAEAIIKWASMTKHVQIACVVSDKKSALVLERAKKWSIPTLIFNKNKKETRHDFDQRILFELKEYSPDWIVLAGYMKLLTINFLNQFPNKVVNIHPSLLPLFPGKDGYGEAYKAGMKESGCTIHYVDEGMDTGLIIDQRKFSLIDGESFEDFKQRGLLIENEFYPSVLEKLFSESSED